MDPLQPQGEIPQPGANDRHGDPPYGIPQAAPNSDTKDPSIGRNDLSPDFSHNRPGAPITGAEGNTMGPDHPFFHGKVTSPQSGDPNSVLPGGTVAPPPAGARFDPYGPPGTNASMPRPDHFRPPDWGGSNFRF
eukprot:TRINITY_DN3781_c1_g1_i4.p1 TRINITY_DN3781_c1_g1~~TRINITY_DN3781_c1_g1_i4.p1  ORF type:complete len:134 (+),score=14.43 TRINITY_DN3781_c1_g1_i4:157-558(+)